MRMIFHADASPQIGAGHVMRVATIAEKAIQEGYECHFVGEITGLVWVKEYIAHLGFQTVKSALSDISPIILNSILVFDSYNLSEDSICLEGSNWALTVNVCDRFTPHYPADLYVLQDLSVPANGRDEKVLSGPDFILLRQGISKSRRSKNSKGPLNIVVAGGGSDPFRFVEHVLLQLIAVDFDFKVDAFADYPLPALESPKFTLHKNGPSLDRIAPIADLVITTASTTSLEFIAREIPTLIACVTPNQIPNYKDFSRLGYALPIGERTDESGWNIDSKTLESAIILSSVRESLISRIQELIDLKATSRVLDEIELRISEKSF
jgi:spore coat polysaccharide biosynthesis predicted glycosyltransferase SpsG